MLDFYDIRDLLSDDEHALAETARELCDRAFQPSIAAWHERDGIPRDVISALGGAGLFAPNLTAFGFPGASANAYGAVMRELERVDSGLRSVASVQGALAAYAIHEFGSDEHKASWLPRLRTGDAVGAFALTEPEHGSDPSSMETTALPDGDSYVINGAKRWSTNGEFADAAVIWARDDKGYVGGYLVERDTPGVTRTNIDKKWSLRAAHSGVFTFRDARIPAANKLPAAKGLRAALACLSNARFGIAWGVLGVAEACYDAALQRAKSRQQFGRPIAGFQLTQEKLAYMATEITKAQLLAWRLGNLIDAGTATPTQVSMAKRNNSAIARECARLAREILGGDGVTDDFPVMRHLMNMETVITYEGTHEVHTLILGHALTGENAFGR